MKQQVVTFNNIKNAEMMHTKWNKKQNAMRKEQHNYLKESRVKKLFEFAVNNDR